MDSIQLTCISCPLGCALTVAMEAGQVTEVTGNACRRGDTYARKEVTNPTRVVTSIIRVSGSRNGEVTVPCKTRTDIPKPKIFDCIRAIKDIVVPAPIHIGDVLLADVAGTGVDIVATKEVC